MSTIQIITGKHTLLMAAVLGLAILYIYSVNSVVVDSLSINAAGEQLVRLEEEVMALHSDLTRMSLGSSLEERARAMGLFADGSLHFVAQEEFVARAEPR